MVQLELVFHKVILFNPKSAGGSGVISPRVYVMYYAKRLSFYLSVLNNDDPNVRQAARYSLKLHMEKRKAIPVHDDDCPNFAGYVINNTGNIAKQSKVNWPKSIWVNLHEMCKRQHISLIKGDDKYLYEMAVDEEVSITFDSPDKFYTTFKQQLLQQYQSEFKAKSSQGRVTREAGKVNHGVSSTYLNNHKIDDNLRSFVARGRLQLLQCESLMTLYYPESYTKSCKICNHPTETVSHILNGCTKFQKLYQQRHNRIVDLIFGKIANSNPGKETFKDTVLKPEMFDAHMRTFEHQHKLPDTTVIDKQNKYAT